MARKKNVEETAVETTVSQENVEDITVKTPESKENVETPAPKTEQVQDIPEAVDKLLKSYPNYSALYIDLKGGVFPDGTQPNLVKDAILYQNPYYKS